MKYQVNQFWNKHLNVVFTQVLMRSVLSSSLPGKGLALDVHQYICKDLKGLLKFLIGMC